MKTPSDSAVKSRDEPPIIDTEVPKWFRLDALPRECQTQLANIQVAAIRRFCEAVERERESIMLSTGQTDGHYAAMQKLLSEL